MWERLLLPPLPGTCSALLLSLCLSACSDTLGVWNDNLDAWRCLNSGHVQQFAPGKSVLLELLEHVGEAGASAFAAFGGGDGDEGGGAGGSW